MMNIKSSPQTTPVLSDIKISQDGMPSRSLIGEFDGELKKKINSEISSEQMIQAALAGAQPQAPVIVLTAEQHAALAAQSALSGEGEALPKSTSPLEPFSTQPLTTKPQKQSLTPSEAKAEAAALRLSRQNPALTQGMTTLPAGMKPVAAGELPQGLLPSGAEVISVDGEKQPEKVQEHVPTPAPKKSLSGSDFLQTRMALNTAASGVTPPVVSAAGNVVSTKTKPTSETPSISDLVSSGVGLQSILAGAEKKDSNPSDHSSSQEKDQSAMRQLAQGLATTPMGKAASFDPASILSQSTTAQVTSGGGATQRLSTDAVVNLGSQIQNFGTASGGGEIRLRLKPDHLGEIFIQVNTVGNNVDLKVRASDNNAKKIIEESLGALRESLSVHNLSLGTIDVAASQPTQSQSQSQFDMSHQSRQGMGDVLNQNSNQNFKQGQSAYDRFNDGTLPEVKNLAAASGLKRMGNQMASGSGRLNVLA